MNSFAESFLELIYPEKNICCICDTYDEKIGEKYICKKCSQAIHTITPPYCIKCCKPIEYDSSINLCPDCLSFEKYFEAARSPYSYDGIIKKCIYNFKYYNKPYFYKFFGNALVNYIEVINYNNFDFILSVPLHSSKLKIRGYNQSELLGRYIAEKLNKPYINALKRVNKTAKQSSKSKENRLKSLINAFKIRNPHKSAVIKKSSVLLVDDVYTTGATVNECSKVLHKFGVDKVYVLTIAR